MEPRIDGKDFPECATLNQFANGLHCRYRAITQINPEQRVCVARSLDYPARLKSVSPEWLLAKHRYSVFECSDRLFGVKSIGCSDDNSVEIVTKQLLKRREENCVWGDFVSFLCRACLRAVATDGS